MRRGPGISGIQRQDQTKQLYRQAGQDIAEQRHKELEKQLVSFQTHLETFARNHSKEIRSNVRLRNQFQKMCLVIGVDPLQSSKGFWADLLGQGDFYYELAVQIVDICMRTRDANGGLLEIGDALTRLRRIRKPRAGEPDLTPDDILRAVRVLAPLGGGFSVVAPPDSDQRFVQSVPHEFAPDLAVVLRIAQQCGGSLTAEQLGTATGWAAPRIDRVLASMISDGVCWLDAQATPRAFCIPSLVHL